MNAKIHKSKDRGYFDHGWLKTYHSFSFSSYYDPDKVQFGALRVLNDDYIAPGEGFGTHPHDNMEIVTIPLTGEVAHEDSHGHKEVIYPGEVQVMSAGTGIHHSEYNNSKTDITNLLQIWVFPDKKGHEPRYDQKKFDPEQKIDKWQTLVSPDKNNDTLWLNQQTWFRIRKIKEMNNFEYKLNSKELGLFLFVIEGSVQIGNEKLNKRDAIEISDIDKINLNAYSETEILTIEIPLK